MNLFKNDYTTNQLKVVLNAESARKYSIINYHEKNKSLYLKVWNEGIAPAIANGECHCFYPQSSIGDSGQQEDIKDYFGKLGYNVNCGHANYIEIYW